jgi:hypothetical protein
MNAQIQPETIQKMQAALRAVIDQYVDDDYAEGDSYAVALSREALAAIEADQAPTQLRTDN